MNSNFFENAYELQKYFYTVDYFDLKFDYDEGAKLLRQLVDAHKKEIKEIKGNGFNIYD